MPMFRTTPSSSLTGSMRSILQSGNLGPLGEIQAGMVASRMQHESALAEKARLENEQLRAAASMREDPNVATEYAGHAAGLDMPQATQLARYVRGEMQPNAQGPADAADNVYGPERVPLPENLPAGARGQFQTALAALLANQLGTGKTNAAQLATAGSTLNKEGLVTQAANTVDIPAANRITAAVAGKLRYPYSPENASGTITQRETGVPNEGTQLAGAVRDLTGARTGAAGAQADLARTRAAQVKAGKPPTPVAPERVQRMIDMSTKDEHSALIKAWDALPLKQRKLTPRPTLGDARAAVEKRYRGMGTAQDPGFEGDMVDAQQALEGGADPDQVATRFKQRWGHDLGDLIDLSEYD